MEDALLVSGERIRDGASSSSIGLEATKKRQPLTVEMKDSCVCPHRHQHQPDFPAINYRFIVCQVTYFLIN